MAEDEKPDEPAKPRKRVGAVRSTDLEPYTGLRWVATLFKAAAVFVFVALAAEFIAGLRMTGASSIPVLLGETLQTAVMAVVLWGGGDLVRLLVDIGHDMRAQRILMVRILSRTPKQSRPGGPGSTPGTVEDDYDEEAEELNIHE